MTLSMINQAKPHRLIAVIDGCELRLEIVCPYTKGEPRPCRMGMEGERCDWHHYDDGGHHDACPAAKDRNAECMAPDDSETGCWPFGPPEKCDGWNHAELGHIHETNGCFAQFLVNEWGWDEAVRWIERGIHMKIDLPVDVWIDCDEEDGVTLAPWPLLSQRT